MNNKSFTLIELLVVIVIIGILAGVIMISTSSSIDKANITKSKVFEESVSNNLAANMVSRWKLDEIINTNKTPDQWGSNTGTLYGTDGLPSIKTEGCVTGNCMEFDGVDDSIDFGNEVNLQFKTGTISVWFNNFKEIYPGDTGIVTKTTNGGWNNQNWQLLIEEHNEVRFSVGDGYTYDWQQTGAMVFPKINNWYYVVVTFTYEDLNGDTLKDTKVEAFLNGEYKTGFTRESFCVGINRPIKIGTDGSRYFNGLIDDVRKMILLYLLKIKQNYIAGLNSLLPLELFLKKNMMKE